MKILKIKLTQLSQGFQTKPRPTIYKPLINRAHHTRVPAVMFIGVGAIACAARFDGKAQKHHRTTTG